MYYVYALEDLTGKLYIGQTSNLDIRLNWHNTGKSRYTKNKGPWTLVGSRSFSTRSEAVQFERYLKSLKRPVIIRTMFNK